MGKWRQKRQTITVDHIACPACGHMFNGFDAVNNDVETPTCAQCPACGVDMSVICSVEYTATLE